LRSRDEFTGLAGDDAMVMEVEDAAFGERERLSDRCRTVHQAD
jgi:hypothetical protein